MRDELAPVFARRGDRDEIERRRRTLLGGSRHADDLVARVTDFLDANPDATTRAVVAAVGARRKDVLAVVRTLRSVPSGSRRGQSALSELEAEEPKT